IEMRGHGHLSNSITIYFRADCTPLVEGRNQGVIYVTNPVLRGFFRLNRSAGSGFLVVNLIGDIARPEIVAQYPDAPWANVAEVVTPERAEYLLRAAIGVPDFPVEIVDVATWRAVADSAERYGDGRVFLAGDAAHTVPPNGGYGGNTGIGDAWDISWKLAAVLNGEAGPALLDTYDAERRPLGEAVIEQAYGRYVTRVATYIGADGIDPIVDDTWIELGPRYRSSAVAGEDDGGAVLNDPAAVAGHPGSRAPHVWLDVDGKRVSTIDLFGRGWVLLAASDDWQAPAGVERHVVPAGVAEAYGIGATGASLVRPDGFVAWRASAPGEDVGAVHARLLGR
ncbi:MAG TPA: FAD-dependent monooxygenase, partial [Solirubrobacteraceae bacterium]|nr:FAD-dependent monooxygenase [Solirubrobacteraceae bacterium]